MNLSCLSDVWLFVEMKSPSKSIFVQPAPDDLTENKPSSSLAAQVFASWAIVYFTEELRPSSLVTWHAAYVLRQSCLLDSLNTADPSIWLCEFNTQRSSTESIFVKIGRGEVGVHRLNES